MDYLTDKFEFLDGLRDGGSINMFGAAPVLAEEFDLPIKEARSILSEWQRTFDGISSAEDRAALADVQ